jgi:hypothetical protein
MAINRRSKTKTWQIEAKPTWHHFGGKINCRDLIVGAYNRGLGVYLVQNSKTQIKGENGERKDKISFLIGKIH